MSDVTNSKYVVQWKAASVSLLQESGDLTAKCILDLKADGTATMTSEDEVIEYNWKETDYGVYLDCLGKKSDLKLKADGPDTLNTRILFVTLSFKREK